MSPEQFLDEFSVVQAAFVSAWRKWCSDNPELIERLAALAKERPVRYRSVQYEVNAHRVVFPLNLDALPDWLRRRTNNSGKLNSVYLHAPEKVYAHTKDGRLAVQHGDWLIENEWDELSVVPDLRFGRLFAPVDNNTEVDDGGRS